MPTRAARKTGSAGTDADDRLLRPGAACWRRETAGRAALIIDMADYFDAAMTAMSKARHTVYLLNWAFEPQTLLHPQPGCAGPQDDRIADFLKALAKDNPQLDVRILCWQSALPVAATQNWFPLADRKAFAGTQVKFVLDGKLPMGASHHQKAIIIDDAMAFCGGGDIGPDRWDTPLHLDDDPRREKTKHDHGNSKNDFDSRHEVMGAVDGDAAKALGDLFRDRWVRCTKEVLTAPPTTRPAWPAQLKPQFRDIDVGLSRTYGAWGEHSEVREVEALHLAAIARAQRSIYMENQYFTSPLIAAALARRLAEPDGPEVILIGTEHSPSYFDQATMDHTRVRFLERLVRADKFGRLRAYSPVTTLGRIIIVHAKLTIIDDRLLRIGSANINNRSMGFDSECDMSFEATAPGDQAMIAGLRTQLLAHWFGCENEIVEAEIARSKTIGEALETLRNEGYARLRPILRPEVKGLAAVIADYHLGDPCSPSDAWRPWRRKALAQSQSRKAARAGKSAAKA